MYCPTEIERQHFQHVPSVCEVVSDGKMFMPKHNADLAPSIVTVRFKMLPSSSKWLQNNCGLYGLQYHDTHFNSC